MNPLKQHERINAFRWQVILFDGTIIDRQDEMKKQPKDRIDPNFYRKPVKAVCLIPNVEGVEEITNGFSVIVPSGAMPVATRFKTFDKNGRGKLVSCIHAVGYNVNGCRKMTCVDVDHCRVFSLDDTKGVFLNV